MPVSATLPRTDPRRAGRRGWRRWLLPAFIGMLVGALAGTDYLVGRYQEYQLQKKRDHRKKLERIAWFHIRADFDRVAYTDDGKYRVTTWIENAFPENPAYVMMPTLRTYIQVGPQWKEVAGTEPKENRWTEGTVVRLDGKVEAERIFDIRERGYFELLPGYMHIRFDNVMYIADDPEPKDEVIERSSVYYIHLRPIGADDAKLGALNSFPGRVPVFISMPPH
jgi:hypothetical protein